MTNFILAFAIAILCISGSFTAKAANLINVKLDYGAIADGSHDDTKAIIRAVESANDGDTIYFPPGRYKLENMGSVMINKNINMLGEHAVLDGIQGGAKAKFILGNKLSDIKIEGLHFTNFNTAIARNDPNYTYKNIQILHNKFTDCESGVILGAKASEIIIMGNMFKNIVNKDTRAAVAISVGNYVGDTELENSTKVIVTDNIIENVVNKNPKGRFSYAMQILARDVIVKGNTIDKVDTINNSSQKAEGLYLKAYGAIISNNHFHDAGSNNYLKLKNGNGPTNDDLGDYIISNNIFRTSSIPATEHIITIHEDAIDISNNWFINCRSDDSLIEAEAYPVQMIRIRNNTFRSCNAPNFINIENSNHEVTGNSFFNIGGNTSQKHTSVIMIRTITAANPLENVTIANNRFYFNSNLRSASKYHSGICLYISGESTDGIYVRNNEFFGYNHESIKNESSTIRALNFWRDDSTSTHKNYDVSGNIVHGRWRDTDAYLRMNYGLESDGMAIIDNKPAGGEINLTKSTKLKKGESGVTVLNEGAKNNITLLLPPAERGLVFRGVNLAKHALRFDPVSKDSILGGHGRGKYVSLDTGASLELKCFTTGRWSITAQSGKTAFEQSKH